MSVFRRRVDPLERNFLERKSLRMHVERFAQRDRALLGADAAAANHEIILLDEAIMRESAHRIDVFFRRIEFGAAILLAFGCEQRFADSIDLLVHLGAMMIAFLAGTRDRELNARRMPSTDTSDLKIRTYLLWRV